MTRATCFSRQPGKRSALLSVVLCVSVVGLPREAGAAFHTVTSFGDSGAAGQLRTLIDVAAPGDTIFVPPGTIVLTGAPDEDANATGDLDLTRDLTIIGSGPEFSILDAGHLDRVFDIRPGATVVIAGVTMRHGDIDPAAFGGSGGALVNRGTLTLVNIVAEDSFAGGGGGIANFSGLVLVQASTIRRNESTGVTANGGGISNFDMMVISDTTVSENKIFGTSASTLGGGIINVGTMAISNSTVSGNDASGNFGGGIFHAFAGTLLTLTNVTIAGNRVGSGPISGHGGGLASHSAGKTTIVNTLIAENETTSGVDPDCSGTIDSSGYNLIEDATGCTLIGVLTGNILGLPARLEPLADYGGPTLTHGLRRNSPAVDAASDPVCRPVDQRGVSRPADGDGRGGAQCDIGSFELEER